MYMLHTDCSCNNLYIFVFAQCCNYFSNIFPYFPMQCLLPIFWNENYMVLAFPARSSRQGEFHPKPLTEPYVIVSHHTALVIISLAYSPLSNGRTYQDSTLRYNAKDAVLSSLTFWPFSLFSLTILQASDSQNLCPFETLHGNSTSQNSYTTL